MPNLIHRQLSYGTLRYHWAITLLSVRAGINPPFTSHRVRSTTFNILSSRNMKNRHIRAVTGHKSDASLESYNDRPTFEQFQDMSSAITEFVNLSKPEVALRPVLPPLNFASSAAGLNAIQPNTSTDIQIVQENIQFSTQSCKHGIISGGSFANCSFNFHFK